MEISIQKQVNCEYKTDPKASINYSSWTFSLKDSEDALLNTERTSLFIWPPMSTSSGLQKLLQAKIKTL